MKFEEINLVSQKLPEKKKLYPERAYSRVSSSIERLKKLENGEIEKIELSPEEREQLMEFENGLGERLEKIDEIKINTVEFFPKYFLDIQGKSIFKLQTGMEIEGDNEEDVRNFLCVHRQELDALDGKILADLAGKSKKFVQEQLLEKISSTMKSDGEIDINVEENPTRVGIVLNPENAMEKIKQFRKFKQELKNIIAKCDGAEEMNGSLIAKEKVLNLYRKRINELIVGIFPCAVQIKEMANLVGEEILTEDEKEILTQFPGMQNFVAAYSRYDRFVHGVDEGKNEKGNDLQVGENFLHYADEVEAEALECEKSKRKNVAEKGLDYEKIFTERNVKKETFVQLAEEILEKYGQKSVEPGESYDPKRKGSATDGKWQVVARDENKNMGAYGKSKTIKLVTRDRTVRDLMGTLVGHEEVHFLQALNREKIPLRLFHKIGGDRMGIFEEGGAMMMENEVTSELFGTKSLPIVHYVRAMEKRLQGGSYLDCVKAYHESSLKLLRINMEGIEFEDEKFKEESKRLLGVAIRGTDRLFPSGDDYKNSPSTLARSKDTVYLEQFVLMNKLKENGMEKYAFMVGLNLDSMAELMEMGMLDAKNIELLDMSFIMEKWNEIKKDFALEA
jgi:hypothetical protein